MSLTILPHLFKLQIYLAQRVAFWIMLLFEQNQDCSFRFKTNKIIDLYYLTLSLW